eukprot:607756_1
MAAPVSEDLQIKVMTGHNKSSTISVPSGCSVHYLVQMIADREGPLSCPTSGCPSSASYASGVTLIYMGRVMNMHRNISDYGVRHGSIIVVTIRRLGGGLATVWYENKALQVGGPQQRKHYIKQIAEFSISIFHVSCRSDKIMGQNMIGIVLYLCDNQQLFYLNGMKCRSGYILLVSSHKLAQIQTKAGTMHSKAFKYFAGKDLQDMNIVGGGFGIKNGDPVFRSWTFNAATAHFHDGKKEMHPMEQQCIKAAINNWKKNVQNTKVSDLATNGSCGTHGFY